METNFKNAIETLYKEKENLVILGLTGRTGAGCSTVADILKKKVNELDLEFVQRKEFDDKDKYKFNIIKQYIEAEHWVPFEVIEGSCVILSYVFEENSIQKDDASSGLIAYINSLQNETNEVKFKIENSRELENEIRGLSYCFEEVKKKPLNKVKKWTEYDDEELNEYYELYIRKLPQYKNRIHEILAPYSCYEMETGKLEDKEPVKYHLYTYLLQKIGNNIRSSGHPFDSKFQSGQILCFAERLSLLIELIIEKGHRENRKTRICIDAIRNVNESNYLKDKYKPYFLLSISVDEQTRSKRLQDLDIKEKIGIDNVEYLGKYKAEAFFYQQNIAQCIEMADIHIFNEEVKSSKKFFLTWQLVKYITLMIHPGLITPTSIERGMQLAYTAKFNSGCLSRQVGAIVTGEDYSVKAVGWNDVPAGQMPCNLRNAELYCKGNHEDCFSQYEVEENRFQRVLKQVQDTVAKVNLNGRKFSICFKDIYNGYTHERNQVFTRSLHAEENAFLQISKYGGQAVKGGKLFVTASPCELCSKKSYQLGITDIYYIDPYPGIAQKHILNFGNKQSGPQSHLFYGAIGDAYISLYKPLMAYKDELELVSGINCRMLAENIEKEKYPEPQTMDLIYDEVEFTISFINREKIESKRKVSFVINNGEYSKITRKLVWTGSSYDGTELLEGEYSLTDEQDKMSPYHYTIDFGRKLGKGDSVEYKIVSRVKDETHMMHPYFAHYVKNPTKKLILRIEISKNDKFLDNIVYKRYADKEMEYEYPDFPEIKYDVEEKDDIIAYILKIDKPNLFYMYCFEWEFIKIKD